MSKTTKALIKNRPIISSSFRFLPFSPLALAQSGSPTNIVTRLGVHPLLCYRTHVIGPLKRATSGHSLPKPRAQPDIGRREERKRMEKQKVPFHGFKRLLFPCTAFNFPLWPVSREGTVTGLGAFEVHGGLTKQTTIWPL